MTQEELDALMNADVDGLDEEIAGESEPEAPKELSEADEEKHVGPFIQKKVQGGELPFPATHENKMVHQLDDVTRESEEKAGEIFDIVENVSNELMEKEGNIQNVMDTLNSNVELFQKLNEKFPEVEAFKTALERNEEATEELNAVLEMCKMSGDDLMNVMDIMQFQDIHRQKIERVINAMRALSRYMSTLFEGQIADEKRVSSAQHLHGDEHNDLASEDDLEALLAQFGKK
ncbi:MAG: chemotaxis protein [Campylobacterales bacterium]|nr:chemotaxis protein [Campylobacterales bacterium]